MRDGMFIEVWFDQSSASVDLLEAADARRPLDVYVLYLREYVGASFRNAHPLPKRSFSSEPVTAAAILERTGESSGAPVELYRSHDGYMIVRPAQEDGQQSLRLAHDDLGFLERVSASVSGKISWAEAPVAPRV